MKVPGGRVGGGREHALCWALAGSPAADEAVVRARAIPASPRSPNASPIGAMDIAGLVAFAAGQRVDLVVLGPEAPLVAGLADAWPRPGCAAAGPTAAAAQLEGSKTFTKEIADAAGIPTARWERFDDPAAARAYIRAAGRADRGQGRWARRRQGRGGRGDRGRGRGRHRRHHGDRRASATPAPRW